MNTIYLNALAAAIIAGTEVAPHHLRSLCRFGQQHADRMNRVVIGDIVQCQSWNGTSIERGPEPILGNADEAEYVIGQIRLLSGTVWTEVEAELSAPIAA